MVSLAELARNIGFGWAGYVSRRPGACLQSWDLVALRQSRAVMLGPLAFNNVVLTYDAAMGEPWSSRDGRVTSLMDRCW